jgi:hypothetical protein
MLVIIRESIMAKAGSINVYETPSLKAGVINQNIPNCAFAPLRELSKPV